MSSPSRLVRGNSFVSVELYFNFSLFEPHAWRIIIIINCTYIGQHRDRVVSRSSRSSPQCRHIVLLLFCVFLSNKDFYCSTVSEQYTNSNLCSVVLRNSYHGAYRQGIIRGVPPSPNVSAQTPYVLGGWATPV